MHRVKVYRLNGDGAQVDDMGTGQVSIDYMEDSGEIGIHVIDEDDMETLLAHRISTEIKYKKEKDTIISWRDTELSVTLAVSFQEAVACSHLMNHIYSTQRTLQTDALFGEVDSLPNVNLSTLPQIHKIVTKGDIADQRLIELILKDKDFFQKLMAVFETCESTNNVDGLHMIYDIVNATISLKSSQILDIILGNQLITKIIGCLEHDRNVPQSLHYRKYLRERVVFKEAIPIKDPLVLSKIHQTYIIAYLKDVVFTKVLYDATSVKLNSVIDANISTVLLTLLRNDGNIIRELYAMLRSPSTSVESRNNLVDFLHEFCSSCKSLAPTQKLEFFGKLVSEGIFDIIAEVLQSPDKKLVLKGTEILSTLLKQDPTLLRSYVLRQETPLFGLLVKGLMEDFGEKMQKQFLDLVQTIWECGGAEQQRITREIFCREHIPELVDSIAASCPEDASIRVGRATPEVLLNICEFLCFCVRLDSSSNTYFLAIASEKVLLLTRRKEKPVVAAAVRFLRTLLSNHDASVQRYIAKNNRLKPIIDVFVAGGHRDNLLNSAILELLEHIRKLEKATKLLKYVVETFWDQLAPFEDLPSILALKTTYEKCVGSMAPTSPIDPFDSALDDEMSDSPSTTEIEEEAKHQDSNKVAAGSVSPSKRPGGLVDYEDDKDKEEKEEIKRQRICSTSEENKNSPEQGDEAKRT